MAQDPPTKHPSNPPALSPDNDGGWDISEDFGGIDGFAAEDSAPKAPVEQAAVPAAAAPLAPPSVPVIASVSAPMPPPMQAAQAAPPPVSAPPKIAPRLSTGAAEVVENDAASNAEKSTFRAESSRLALARDWAALAALIRSTLDSARWAAQREARASLLGDLARIYRDRLRDAANAEFAFRRLREVAPSNPEALEFLARRYRECGDFRALFELRKSAVEATWDPRQRLEWTREAATIAAEKLHAPDLVIEAWERLFQLGDAVDTATRALSEAYREARRWDRLAEFLIQRAATLDGTAETVVLRELAEVYLSGMREHEQAARVLERILAQRPSDPIARLSMARVLARRKDWRAFAELGLRPLSGVEESVQLDVRRLVAEALRSAGQLEYAAAIYDLILAASPKELEAWNGKEEYLVASGKLEALVEFLAKRSEICERDDERAALLERAALIAEKELLNTKLAVALEERRANIAAVRPAALLALVRLYEASGDNEGLRSALERQLALVVDPQARIELLRRLGAHCAHRLFDSARAESCWLQILAAVPDDREVREELVALYRKRGDFESVDRTLTSQAWRPCSDAELLAIFFAVAQNVEENIKDPERAIVAWRCVLDLAPDDPGALRAVIPHYRALGRTRELVAALEAELGIATSTEQRVESGLEIARLWEGEGDRAGAVAALERVLRFLPTCQPALDALGRLCADDPGVVRGATDVALAALSDAAPEALRKRLLDFVDASDHLGRFFALRRLLHASAYDPALIVALDEAAAQANAWGELAAVYTDLAAQAADEETRTARLSALARLYEEKLHDPVRAFLILSAARQARILDLGEIEPLLRLAEATNRFEDALALLEVAASAQGSVELRCEAIRRRTVLCETRLLSAERAFHEAVRLLRLNPHDRAALDEVRRLAAAAKLWRSLDALYAELWDRADSVKERIELTRARYGLAAGELADSRAALDHLLTLFRLDATQPGLKEQLLVEAERQNAWRRVLPIVEAEVRAHQGTAEELRKIAELQEGHCQDRARAFDLFADALLRNPAASELESRLEVLADSSLRPTLATILRSAAARSKHLERALALFSRVAELYNVLDRSDLALCVHQRIVQLQPTSTPSLRVLIEYRKQHGFHRELRDVLTQLLSAMPDASAEERIAIELSIARLSYERLDDAETALTTYARILDGDPANADALSGIRALTAGSIPRSLELRRLSIELQRASGSQRALLQLACARLQKAELGDPEGALATLRTLVAESGPDGPGFEPLAQLLTERGAFGELVELFESRALAQTDTQVRGEYLERAVAIAEKQGKVVGEGRRERLYRQLLVLHPDDKNLRWRLLRLLRDAERYSELAEELRQLIVKPSHGEEDASTQRFFESELVRLLDHRLDRSNAAEALLQVQIARSPEEPEPLLWMASIKLRKGDRPSYLALRERHARLLPKELGALVLCHLAEACDDQGGSAEQVLGYYRSARTLDPECRPAVEGMKALGRRIKGWRAAAALLPDEGERELSFEARAARLRQKGLASEAEPQVAITWLERAVAIMPDDFAAWDALANIYQRLGDAARAFSSRRAALAAFQRSIPTGPLHVDAHAARIEALAEATRQAGDSEEADRLFARAHALSPALPKAALSVADKWYSEGKLQAAYALYDRVLAGAVPLSEKDRLLAIYQRGRLAAQLGQSEQAICDLREGLRIDPLHPGILHALADVLADTGHPVAAVQHYAQALLVAAQPRQRGLLYARLARLWDDRLKQPEEAGVCYDLAVRAGIEDQDVMMRALSYYRRSGQHERAAEIIDELLRRTTLPKDLATLWTERAHLALLRDEAEAMEAFDMALSYEPTHQPALDGLLAVLERRGEWRQIMDILEARAEGAAPVDRAQALRRLSRIAQTELGDTKRAESYLRTVITLDPQKEDYQQLLQLIGDTPENQTVRRELSAGLIALGEPCMPLLIDVGQRMAAAGQRRYAWVLLSPLLSAVYADQALKATVLGLRKEFEKADLPAIGGRETHRQVLGSPLSPRLLDLLVELDEKMATEERGTEALGAARTTRLDQKTGVGKVFAAIAERLGLEQVHLTRVDELGEPFRLLSDEVPHIAVRSDLLLTLSPGEFQSLFALLLELSRPGARLFTIGTATNWQRLAAGLLSAAGLWGMDAGSLAEHIKQILGESGCQTLAELLSSLPRDPAELAQKLHDAVYATAWRVALLVCGDLRQAARLQTRLDEALPKMPSAGKLEELSDFFAGAPPLCNLAAFAISPICAGLFHS